MIREKQGEFKSIHLYKQSQPLPQTLVAGSTTQVEALALHADRYLVVVSKAKGTKYKVVKYPLHRSGNPQSEPEGLPAGNFDPFTHDCKIRIVSQREALSAVIVSPQKPPFPVDLDGS